MDNMPPLPNSEYGLSFYDEGGAHELPGRSYTADQMHAYARAYAEQRVRPLVEALDAIVTELMDGDDFSAAQIARHAGRAALDAEQEKQHG